MAITESQIEGLSKQVFLYDYILNGLFPCQSDVVRLIRANKREWTSNDKFEYRMLLSTTNTGGTLNSQVFSPNVSLNREGSLEYGQFFATYGTVSDGMNIDMTINLETKDKKAAFESDFAMRMHALRTNVASLFKNFAIHGKFGVVHQLRSTIGAPHVSATKKPMPNVFAEPPAHGVPFTIATPINVYNTNFKAGRYLIKTTSHGTDNGRAPWSYAKVSELYLILENQPGYLTLVSVGVDGSATPWQDGEFLEVAYNRETENPHTLPFAASNWLAGPLNSLDATYANKTIDYFNYSGSDAYTSGANAIVGAMEGLADLFPWYTDPENPDMRLGLDMPFRGQPNRNTYTTEQCGGWVYQQDDENIIDAILRGVNLTTNTVPYAEVGIWINPQTKQQMGYEEGDQVYAIRDNLIEGPIIYQRGINSVDYQVGNSTIKEVVTDANIPTDVIIVGPKGDLSYNCWDNATFEIDNYIQETFSKSEPPKPENISIPDEIVAKMDLSSRITYGSPTLSDGSLARFEFGNTIRHPKNVMPMALHEMGAIFTEYPYTYTVVKLQGPIVEIGAEYKPSRISNGGSTSTLSDPKITKDLPATVDVASGENATLTVEATNSDAGTLSYQWYKGTAADKVTTKVTGETNNTLTLTNPSGTNYYVCVITNTLGLASKAVVSNTCKVTVA